VIVLILINSKGISQNSNDDTTICIPKLEIQRAINIIETGKIANEELKITKAKVVALEDLIINKDSIINKLRTNIDEYKRIVQNYSQTEHNSNIIISNQIKLQEVTLAKYKKQRFGKWVTLILGASIGFLISK
jgi:hypothetical protein